MPMLTRRSLLANSIAAAGSLPFAAPLARAAAPGMANIRIEIDPEGLYNVQTISLIVSNVLGGYLLALARSHAHLRPSFAIVPRVGLGRILRSSVRSW